MLLCKFSTLITGDGIVKNIQNAHRASLNVVQCLVATMHLAKKMKEKYDIPVIKVSYFGIEDVSRALYDVVNFFQNKKLVKMYVF